MCVNEGALSSFSPSALWNRACCSQSCRVGWGGSLHAALWPIRNGFTIAGGNLGLKMEETGSSYCKPKGKSLEKSRLPDRITEQLKEHAWKYRDGGSRDCWHPGWPPTIFRPCIMLLLIPIPGRKLYIGLCWGTSLPTSLSEAAQGTRTVPLGSALTLERLLTQ